MEYFSDLTRRYLGQEKTFIINPSTAREIVYAAKQAKKLFPKAKIETHEDPLQTGSLFLVITDIDIVVRETKEFADMVINADNFEIYSNENEEIVLSICFNHVYELIRKGNEK